MPLPNFLICGAEKAGTTALFYFLKEHPEISVSTEKELNFFTFNYKKSIKWYVSKFKIKDGTKAIGEASPSYMYDPAVPQRIKSILPQVKLIFILRHPVERAYSNYWHDVNRSGKETLSFDKAIKRALIAEREGIEGEEMRIGYLIKGKYVVHLKRFFEVFSKDRILILIHKDLLNNPEEVMKNVFRFLGVNENFKSDRWYEKHNVGITPKLQSVDKIVKKVIFGNSFGLHIKFFMENHMNPIWKFAGRIFYREGYPPMKTETRKILLEYYEPYNRELEKILNRSLDWWYE